MKELKKTTSIDGVLLCDILLFSDARGSFRELYHEANFRTEGIDAFFVQDNLSVSKKGVLRGMHFQAKTPQAKLIIPLSGSIYDVIVDLRRDSPTFGKFEGHILDSGKSLFVPRGFAHGFLSLEDDTTIFYKCDEFYDPNSEGGIIWNDRDIVIDWQKVFEIYDISEPILSKKDTLLPSFFDYKNNPLF